MVMWRSAFIVSLLLFASPAVAGDLGKASDGYVYFHRTGADEATHDVAVDECANLSASIAQPYLMRVAAAGHSPAADSIGNLIAGAIQDAQQNHLDRRQFLANIENCMVVRGWDVVRVDEDEGRRVSALSQPEQAAMLSRWVGATEVHGEIVRTFQPIPTETMLVHGVYDHLPPPSLSLTAGAHRFSPKLSPADPTGWRPIKPSDPGATQAPDASVIVVRMLTSAPGHQLALLFAKVDEAAQGQDKPRMDYVMVASPVRFLWGHGPALETTFVVPVQPGRWRLLSSWGISLCLGGPAFDVRPGEAVFAGSFDAAAKDYLAPDMSPAPAVAALRDTALAARLRPAGWENRVVTPCALGWANIIYAYDIPGAPKAVSADP
ncbi:MAG TPA: hypothetical protein VGI95_03020 [Caulobacteraceae bacterium]|jgi:hypothetical protein